MKMNGYSRSIILLGLLLFIVLMIFGSVFCYGLFFGCLFIMLLEVID